jgi:hypothetical protein
MELVRPIACRCLACNQLFFPLAPRVKLLKLQDEGDAARRSLPPPPPSPSPSAACSATAAAAAATAAARGGGSRQCDELANSEPESCAALETRRPRPSVPPVLAE